MGNGHLGDRGTIAPEAIAAFGKRIRHFNSFGGNPASCAVAHAVLKVIKAGRRLVLIGPTGNEGQILKIRSPLVFSSKDAKLFLATLDEALTAPWRTPPAGLPVQARGRWDQGRLIEPTRSVSAPLLHCRPRFPEKTLHMASGKEVLIAESDVYCCRWSLRIGHVLDVALVHRRRVDVASSGNPR